MILVENINYLRKHYPAIREEMKTLEEAENKTFQMEETRKGAKTLSYTKEDKKAYFHSKYDPLKEAQILAEEYQNLEGKTIIFYGTGLGYHIDLIVKANPASHVYIFEPIPELLEAFLSVQNLSRTDYKNLKNITLGFDNLVEEVHAMLDLDRENIVFVELPSHKNFYEAEHKIFIHALTNISRDKRSNLRTTHAFQKKWTTNSMKNFKEVLNSPNILIEKKGAFIDKPALLIAAGPSLNEEIENIRYIKEHALAYIFSVGSAINTLIHHNIYPHAVTTYDPTDANEKVFALLKEKGISSIPMIFGSSVTSKNLENYLGKKYHMITNQDTVSTYYLLDKGEEMDVVADAPSIAVVTMQLLENMGFAPIILVGQNLGYRGKERHSEGVSYSKELTDQEEKNALFVPDVYGNTIKTNDNFNSMRKQMESYIEAMAPGRVLNTTKGGAKIQGSEFRELKDILDQDLKEKVVDPNWLAGNKTNYKKQTLENKAKNMDISLETLNDIIKESNTNLQTMARLFLNRNFKQLDLMYSRQDAIIGALEANPFFRVFLQQMNQVHYDLLYNEVRRFKTNKNINEKHKQLLANYQIFMNRCSKDLEDIQPIYEEIHEVIQVYHPEEQEIGMEK